ncbi:MAG: hypothetical protein ABEJ03_00315 [Candidatus Nanohaloarchaea archaeon]
MDFEIVEGFLEGAPFALLGDATGASVFEPAEFYLIGFELMGGLLGGDNATSPPAGGISSEPAPSGGLEVEDSQLRAGIDAVERLTGLDVSEAFDAAGSEPYLLENDTLGRMTPEGSSTGHRLDGYGRSFMGVDDRVRHISQYDYLQTITHETVHGLDFNDELLKQIRNLGFAASEAVFLKDEMLKGRAQDNVDRMEGATEFTARKLNSAYEDVKTASYTEQVNELERRMARKEIHSGGVDTSRNVLDVDYVPGSGELTEVGVFEYDGEAFRYVAEVDGFDTGYGIGEVLDTGIEKLMEGETDEGYSWEDAESSVDIKVDRDDAYEAYLDDDNDYDPQRGSVDTYREASAGGNGLEGPPSVLSPNGGAVQPGLTESGVPDEGIEEYVSLEETSG